MTAFAAPRAFGQALFSDCQWTGGGSILVSLIRRRRPMTDEPLCSELIYYPLWERI
jgi:hypothetical protein